MSSAPFGIGMAIRVTKENYDRIAIVNGGAPVEVEDGENYFIIYNDRYTPNETVRSEFFFENYEFQRPEDSSRFVNFDKK